ncbi:hypothetical protein AGABI2DRAFT_75906 [Agaricus bisporus var. bisporus H97]|uniref:hypothetical protein n=1 Tax=Agaricus bisporus var. bisporus (strain H97 / ATCC MYA-4626 / FGSC 10389) TaxID=936046 RepID=UPI00029F7D36|nr:hypothetical protein AGABI2DRAFT_75906 [Agaricus bisporus var. bisporus H97]EKV43934.1 hypothetical protein AGABI2DRAFT_75906 [Agaricus bisporus var. bisporus H97]
MHKIGPGVLDPTHPATKTPIRAFPSIRTECFRLSAFPSALLIPHPDSIGTPGRPSIDTWTNRLSRAAQLQDSDVETQGPFDLSRVVAPSILLPHPRKSIPMLLYFSISKAKTHKHAAKRRKLRTRFKEAINLVVTRGAQGTKDELGVPQLEFNDEEVRENGDKWILPDWVYICYPEASLYLMRYPQLVPLLRSSLHKIWIHGTSLEKRWAEDEMRKQAGLPPLAFHKQPIHRKFQPPRTPRQIFESKRYPSTTR